MSGAGWRGHEKLILTRYELCSKRGGSGSEGARPFRDPHPVVSVAAPLSPHKVDVSEAPEC